MQIGSNRREVSLTGIKDGNKAHGVHIIGAADEGNTISLPDAYLKNGHLLIGAATAPEPRQGNPVRPTQTADTDVTYRHRPKITEATADFLPSGQTDWSMAKTTGDAEIGDTVRVAIVFDRAVMVDPSPGKEPPKARLAI